MVGRGIIIAIYKVKNVEKVWIWFQSRNNLNEQGLADLGRFAFLLVKFPVLLTEDGGIKVEDGKCKLNKGDMRMLDRKYKFELGGLLIEDGL